MTREQRALLKALNRKVHVWLDSASDPVDFDDVQSIYTKGGLVCILTSNQIVKYPLCRIHKIVEPRNA